MNENETTEILRAAIATYGESAQIRKAVEELAELIAAIQRVEFGCDPKVRRLEGEALGSPYQARNELVRNLFEELADARIMLRQLIMIYQCEEEVRGWERVKLHRLAKRIGGSPEEE